MCSASIRTRDIDANDPGRRRLALDLRRLPVLARQQIDSAELPTLYKAAVLALRECHRIDELKNVQDKHTAIAVYAKQIKDDRLLYYAERIKLRAFERIGELLADLPGYEEQKSAAKAAGVNIPDANRAIDTAKIPKRVRDQLIEACPPPKRTTLAQYGREYEGRYATKQTEGLASYLKNESEIERSARTQAYEILDYFRSVQTDLQMMRDGCGGNRWTMSQIGRAVAPADVAAFKNVIEPIAEAIDELLASLPSNTKAN